MFLSKHLLYELEFPTEENRKVLLKRVPTIPLSWTHAIRLIYTNRRATNWLIDCISSFHDIRCNIVHVKQEELVQADQWDILSRSIQTLWLCLPYEIQHPIHVQHLQVHEYIVEMIQSHFEALHRKRPLFHCNWERERKTTIKTEYYLWLFWN